MNNSKNDEHFRTKIQEDIAFVIEHTKSITLEELNENEILLDSVMFRLIQISENSKKLSEEYKADHSDIPWIAIYGLRNRIVHDYGNVDLSIVYSTIKDDLPELYNIMIRK